jgi:signal transduction histidine kinase
MSASQAPPDTTARPSRPAGQSEDSSFEASAFDSSTGRDSPTRWIGWRRRALVFCALLACLLAFSLARLLAASPSVNATWLASPNSQVVLKSSPLPELNAHAGQVLLGVRGSDGPEVAVDALALHRAPRWQLSDQRRVSQLAQQQALSAALAAGPVQLRFGNGAVLTLDSSPRGYAALGVLFWPLIGLGLMVLLFGVVLLLARPQPTSLLFVTMTLCQAGNLWLIALESAPGLGVCAAWLTGHMGLRVALDLCTGAAALHALVLQPHRLARAGTQAAAGWLVVLVWLALFEFATLSEPGAFGPLWVWAQGACLALGGAAWLAISKSYRLEPNPYALVMRRFAASSVVTLLLVTVAVAATAALPGTGASTAEGASVAWYVFVASLLLLTPSAAHTRHVLREFALLAGISTVATALDLLFVAVFSLGSYTSLAMAVFIALGLYAGARQWVVSHLLGSSMLTTERTFDQLYRAAREVQRQPARYAQVMGSLLRELFEPLEAVPVPRAPRRSKVTRGGAVLVVPMRAHDDDGAPTSALALRFANRGQRLFTEDDARLADRVVDQLRRAAAYDLAVERGRAEERLRIAQDLHDDIGARLLTLMYQAQSREMEDYIRHTLQDLKTLTRGLAASEHRLSHAGAEWKTDLTQRLTAAHATLSWSFSADEDLALSVVQWSALTRVLRELVSNSLYHGHASSIEVLFNLKDAELTLQIADDGSGSSPQDWAHGLGLGGVRKRVKLLGGKVAWRENTPRGIVCAVRVAEFGRRN